MSRRARERGILRALNEVASRLEKVAGHDVEPRDLSLAGRGVDEVDSSVLDPQQTEGSGYAPPGCMGLFGDVPCPSTFADWIEDVVHRGIAAGCGNGNFCPGNPT
ncbi:MAG TPA: hypothetical protein VMN82_17510, partial [Thermoanaerobaculia bacterium]|nr:hypothetical protein [Thermoanaerobaculia bacterium]